MDISPQQPLNGNASISCTLTLTAEEWNLIQHGLHELPMKFVRHLSDKIAQQVTAAAREMQKQSVEES